MKPQQPTVPGAMLEGHFLLLRTGSTCLLLRQAEVTSIRPVATEAEPASLALVALSEQLQPLPRRPAGRFVATTLACELDDVGWCWDEVRPVRGAGLQLHPLPPVMRTPHTPVQGWVEVGPDLAFLCAAAALCQYAYPH